VSDIMDILLYMLYSNEIGTERAHIFEVLNNLSSMGHFIRYVNGKRYSSIPVKELGLKTGDNRQWSLWERIKRFMGATPLQGEALVLWIFLKEFRLFFSAIITILRHRPDVIYRRHTLLFNSGYLIARLFHIPSVKEVNAIFFDEIKITKRADSITLWFIKSTERFNMRMADKIIVVTSRLKEVLQKEYKVCGDKIIYIPNGANIDLFKPTNAVMAKETLNLAQDINYVCFVGSLVQWQGVEYLIQSLPLILDQCPNTQLLIVGDGRMKEELCELAEKTGVSNKIIITGMVPYHKVPSYINASDVCVAFFRRERNEHCGLSPLKLCEYMACGKAVIGSRLSGLEILGQQSAGILVEPENASELATAIIRLLQNKELRTQMGNNGRRYVVEYQSWEKVAVRTAEVLSEVIRLRPEEK
jgi:glycosyltransferase involved in cell wall biosynthesis